MDVPYSNEAEFLAARAWEEHLAALGNAKTVGTSTVPGGAATVEQSQHARPTRDELRKAAEAAKAEKKKKAKRKAERDASAFPGAHRGY